ncbi:MAG: hypothetical protein U9O83_03055 [Campylobacterota bacterium]|nr:hypothetical protein [Campylobacterota bacterium]
MAKELTLVDVQKVEALNKQLIAIEEKIYNLAKIQNQVALKKLLEKEITDYELEVHISFYTDLDDDSVASWDEHMKVHFLYDIHHNINDKEDHIIPQSIMKSKELNFQKCCWLTYKLYIDYEFEWIDLLRINNILFDINISYQYQIDINL